jgi:hypothetical protein
MSHDMLHDLSDALMRSVTRQDLFISCRTANYMRMSLSFVNESVYACPWMNFFLVMLGQSDQDLEMLYIFLKWSD